MGHDGILRTVDDFERAYGSPWGRLAFGDTGMRKYRGLAKADDALTTGTSGAFHYIVGAKLWAQMNTEQNIFGAVPKEEWNYSGIRSIIQMPSNRLYGVGEGGTLGDTVKPAFAQYQPKIKLVARNFDATLQQIFLSGRGEGVTWEQYRDFMGVTFGKGLNEMLLKGVEDVDYTSGGTTGVDSNKTYSIDQIATSTNEVANVTGVTAAKAELYGSLARDGTLTDNWADGTSLHNSDVDRSLSLTLLNDAWRTVNVATGDYSMDSFFWITGPDTYQRWGELLQPQQRFEKVDASFSPVNGVKVGMGDPNVNAKFRVGAYEGAPIIVSQDVKQDTLSRIYLQHKDFLRLRVVQPIVYREVGVTTGQELLTNKFTDEGLWYMAGELVTYFPKASAKVRDLK